MQCTENAHFNLLQTNMQYEHNVCSTSPPPESRQAASTSTTWSRPGVLFYDRRQSPPINMPYFDGRGVGCKEHLKFQPSGDVLGHFRPFEAISGYCFWAFLGYNCIFFWPDGTWNHFEPFSAHLLTLGRFTAIFHLSDIKKVILGAFDERDLPKGALYNL